jgi:hypothetical protein
MKHLRYVESFAGVVTVCDCNGGYLVLVSPAKPEVVATDIK